MMQLFLSSSLEILFDIFQDHINQFDFEYESPFIILPDINTRNWLTQKIAREQNIFIGYEFYSFDVGLFSLLDKNTRNNYFLIDHNFLALIIQKILEEENEDFEIIKKYYKFHKNFKGNIFLFSYHLAKIYFDYFKHNENIYNYFNNIGNISEIEKLTYANYKRNILQEQRKLYQKVKKNIENFNLNLYKEAISPYLFREKFVEILKNDIKSKNPVFIFGIPAISVQELKILKELDNNINIYFYYPVLFNYENSNSYNHKAQKISHNTIELFLEVFEKLDIHYKKASEKNHRNFLNSVQDSFLNLGIYHWNDDVFYDNSIKFFKAPSLKEEVKLVISQIQNDILNDPDLKLNEIAIIAPNIKKYLSLIEGMLSYLNIPYEVQQSSTETKSLLMDGIISIVSLLESYELNRKVFSRKLVFEILENPLFQKTYGIDYDFLGRFIKIVEKTSVYNDHKEDYYHSWDLFFKRLRAGNYVLNRISFEENSLKKFIEPLYDFEFSKEDIEVLHQSIYQLMEDIIELYHKENDIEEFYNFFNTIIYKNFIKSNYDLTSSDIKVYYEFKKALKMLEDLQINPSGNFLKQYLKFTLRDTFQNRKNYNLNGVIIANLSYLGVIPFRQVYIMGLTADDFPGRNEDDSFNLIMEFITNEKHKQNILNTRQVHEYFFYQTFFSTKEKIVLSYVYLDLENKKPLYSSYVYEDLKSSLGISEEQIEEKIIYNFEFNPGRVFTNFFDFFNLLLINFRNDFSLLKQFNFYDEILEKKYIQIINGNIHNAGELYRNNKFPEESISLNLQKYQNKISFRSIIHFLTHPIEEYFKKNNIIHYEYENDIEEIKEIPELEIEDYLNYSIIKDSIEEFIKNQKSTEEILKNILMNYLVKGKLNVISIENCEPDELLKKFEPLRDYLNKIIINFNNSSFQFIKKLIMESSGFRKLEEDRAKRNIIILTPVQKGNLTIVERFSDLILNKSTKEIYLFTYRAELTTKSRNRFIKTNTKAAKDRSNESPDMGKINSEKDLLLNFLLYRLHQQNENYSIKILNFDKNLEKVEIKDFFDQIGVVEKILDQFLYLEKLSYSIFLELKNDYQILMDLQTLKSFSINVLKEKYKNQLDKNQYSKNLKNKFLRLYIDEIIHI